MFSLLVVRASLGSLNVSRQSYEGKRSNDLFHRLNVPEGIQPTSLLNVRGQSEQTVLDASIP